MKRILMKCFMFGYCTAWFIWWMRTPTKWVGFLFIVPATYFLRWAIQDALAWVILHSDTKGD